MSKDAVSDWDTTAGNNTDIAGINIDENCPPSGLNNAIRALMAQVKTALASWSVTKLLTGDGSAANPSVAFASDTDTGLYRVSANNLGVAAGGVQIAQLNATTFNWGINPSTADVIFNLGQGRTGDGTTAIDLIGDATYTDYGARLIRANTGANADTVLYHRGTGDLQIHAQDAGRVILATSGVGRIAVSSTGAVTITGGSTMWDASGNIPAARISTNLNSALAAGAILQTVAATPYATNTALSTEIPLDDTVPTNSEGTQILTVNITPVATANKVRGRFQGQVSSAGGNVRIIAAAFRGTTCVGAKVIYAASGQGEYTLDLEFEDSPSSTSALTYTIRVGAETTGGSIYMNGRQTGRELGGASAATLIVQEIKG